MFMMRTPLIALFRGLVLLSFLFSQFTYAVPKFPMLLGMGCPSHGSMQQESVKQSSGSEYLHHASKMADNSAQANDQSASHSKPCQDDSCCNQCKCNTCGHCSATIVFSAFHTLAMREIQAGILMTSDYNHSPSIIYHPPRSLLS